MGIRDFLDHVVYGNLETNDPDLRISERTDNLSHICECGVYVFKCVSVFVCVCVCVCVSQQLGPGTGQHTHTQTRVQ